MKKAVLLIIAGVMMLCHGAFGQGLAADLLAGKLVDPKVGQWAWYDLVNKSDGSTFAVRLAVVGKEKVDHKTGYWLEIEVAPRAGYKSISKMLLTGPANDPRNIHKIIFKNGPEPAKTVKIQRDNKKNTPHVGRRKSLGMDIVVTKSGPIRAEHWSVRKGKRTIELWVNEEIKPCGVVRVVSSDGEMILRSHGFGGPNGESVIRGAVGANGGKSRGNHGSVAAPEVRVETKTQDGGHQ